MNFKEWFKKFCQTLEKKNYVKGIVSYCDSLILYLDIYLNKKPSLYHLSNGTLFYSCLNETYQIIFQYHYLNCFKKEKLNS